MGLDAYTYKFVPFIPRLKFGVFGSQNAEAISTQLDALVRSQIAEGWEYVQLEQVSVVHTAGCLASLFGNTNHTVDYDLVVFRRRAIASPEAAPARLPASVSSRVAAPQRRADPTPTAPPAPSANFAGEDVPRDHKYRCAMCKASFPGDDAAVCPSCGSSVKRPLQNR
jgi:hypothetical protein